MLYSEFTSLGSIETQKMDQRCGQAPGGMDIASDNKYHLAVEQRIYKENKGYGDLGQKEGVLQSSDFHPFENEIAWRNDPMGKVLSAMFCLQLLPSSEFTRNA